MLKQAREACVAKREDANKQKRKNAAKPEAAAPKAPKISQDQSAPKMCKIQFQDDQESSEENDSEDEFEDIPLSCSRSLPMSSNNGPKPSTSESVRIQFRLDEEPHDDEDLDEEIHRKLSEIFGNAVGENLSSDSQSIETTSEASCDFSYRFSIKQAANASKMMKIHYQGYMSRILANEMKAIMHQSYLTDVQFICNDGIVGGNSLILGSMSNFLYNVLADVPIVDKVKTVIMPDVSSVDLSVLFKLLFNENLETKQVSIKDMRRIKNIAALFKLEPILVMTRRPGRPKGSLNRSKFPKVSRSSNKEDAHSATLDNFNIHAEESSMEEREIVNAQRVQSGVSLEDSGGGGNSDESLAMFQSASTNSNLLPSNDLLLDQIVRDNT